MEFIVSSNGNLSDRSLNRVLKLLSIFDPEPEYETLVINYQGMWTDEEKAGVVKLVGQLNVNDFNPNVLLVFSRARIGFPYKYIVSPDNMEPNIGVSAVTGNTIEELSEQLSEVNWYKRMIFQ